MDRARRAGSAALVVLVMVASLVAGGGATVLAGVVAWPPSSLVVSEIQTGGSSASDEFVEVANQGARPWTCMGSRSSMRRRSGSTVTRKGTWTTASSLAPGQRILLVNAAGSYAASVTSPTRAGSRRRVGDRPACRRRLGDRRHRLG
jgi:hypothetical protein